MTKPENNEDKNKKTTTFSKLKNMSKDKKHISIAIGIILVCLVSAFFVWKVYYHGESADYIATQKQINKVNSADKKKFNKIHQDSFPTVQEAHDYLVQATGHKDLTSSAISYKTIDNDLVNKYGKTAMEALVNGYCLDEDMAPNQEIAQEVNLALLDPSQKDYVGFAEKRYSTSFYNPGKVKNLGNNYFIPHMMFATPNNKLSWQADGSYYISSPVVLSKTIGQYGILMTFVQVPSDSDTSVKDFKHEINSIKIKVNDEELNLGGSHKATYSGENQKGLQLSSISQAANGINIWNANNIKAGSIVPVTFDIPVKYLKDGSGKLNINISIDGNIYPSLQAYGGGTKIYF